MSSKNKHKHDWCAIDAEMLLQCSGCRMYRIAHLRKAPRKALRLVPELFSDIHRFSLWLQPGVTLHRCDAFWSIWCVVGPQRISCKAAAATCRSLADMIKEARACISVDADTTYKLLVCMSYGIKVPPHYSGVV